MYISKDRSDRVMVLDSVVCLCVSWLVVLGLTVQGWSGGAMVLGELPVRGASY